MVIASVKISKCVSAVSTQYREGGPMLSWSMKKGILEKRTLGVKTGDDGQEMRPKQ